MTVPKSEYKSFINGLDGCLYDDTMQKVMQRDTMIRSIVKEIYAPLLSCG